MIALSSHGETTSVTAMFTFTASPAPEYCEDQVSSSISSTLKDPSRKRNQFEADLDPAFTDRLPPRSATMPEYDHEEKQQQSLKQKQARQTRSQTIAHRLEAERVQQELDAYLDHIKSLALIIEMQQQSREGRIPSFGERQRRGSTSKHHSARKRNRLGNLSISTTAESEENDADNEWEPFEKWKVRVHPKAVDRVGQVVQSSRAASE